MDTNRGGAMLDVAVTIDNRETQHRIIVGARHLDLSLIPDPCPY